MLRFPFTLYGSKKDTPVSSDTSSGGEVYNQSLFNSVFQDVDAVGKFHNVMLYLVPPEDMQVTAFEDYYPTALYCLKNMGKRGEHAIHHLLEARESLSDILKDAHEMSALDTVERQNKEREIGVKLDAFFRENIRFFAFLAATLELPAKCFTDMKAAADFRIKPQEPIKNDLKYNTRRGSYWHDEGVEEFIKQVKALQLRYDYHFVPGDQTSTERFNNPGQPGLDLKV